MDTRKHWHLNSFRRGGWLETGGVGNVKLTKSGFESEWNPMPEPRAELFLWQSRRLRRRTIATDVISFLFWIERNYFQVQSIDDISGSAHDKRFSLINCDIFHLKIGSVAWWRQASNTIIYDFRERPVKVSNCFDHVVANLIAKGWLRNSLLKSLLFSFTFSTNAPSQTFFSPPQSIRVLLSRCLAWRHSSLVFSCFDVWELWIAMQLNHYGVVLVINEFICGRSALGMGFGSCAIRDNRTEH